MLESCETVSRDRTRYAVTFADAQRAARQAAFSAGVCDDASCGDGQQSAQPWPRYLNADGSVLYGGAPLPPMS